MTSSESGAGCARFRELAPEIALGLVAGHERADALAHLESCPSCREHTAGLGALHDRLRALIPAAEPPVGFEQRALDRLGVTRPRRPAWMARGARLVAAAAVVAAAFAGGCVAGNADRPSSPAVASPLVAGARHVGDVVVSRDRPDFLSVYLVVARPGLLTCELLRTDGSVAATETYEAQGGTGWWGVDRPGADITKIRVSDAEGAVVATGGLPRP